MADDSLTNLSFSRIVKQLQWGPEYLDRIDSMSRPVSMGYGFALLAEGRGVRLGTPREGDSVFALVEKESGVAAAGRLPRLVKDEAVRVNIRRAIESMANDWFTWPRARKQTVKKLKRHFDPVLYEFMRIDRELGRFDLDPKNFSGEVLIFLKGMRGKSLESSPEAALVVAAAIYLGFKVNRVRCVSTQKAKDKVIEFQNEGKKRRIHFLDRALIKASMTGTRRPRMPSKGIPNIDRKPRRRKKDDIEVTGAVFDIELSSTVGVAGALAALGVNSTALFK